jgi:putative colanic acid biosynthesis acetyltransferase WcaF
MKLVKSHIIIDNGCWVCYGAYIGPNVTVAENCVIGAKAVVVKSTSKEGTYVGNPARAIQ